MNCGISPLIERYENLLQRKEKQYAEAGELAAMLYQCWPPAKMNTTAFVRYHYNVMKQYSYQDDIQELKLTIERLKNQQPLDDSLIQSISYARSYVYETSRIQSPKNTHLNIAQRRQIEQGIAAGKSNAQIAREIGVHRSTIGREIKRYAEERENYRAPQAQHLAKLNQRMAHSLRRFESLGMREGKMLEERYDDYPLRRLEPFRPSFKAGRRDSSCSLFYATGGEALINSERLCASESSGNHSFTSLTAFLDASAEAVIALRQNERSGEMPENKTWGCIFQTKKLESFAEKKSQDEVRKRQEKTFFSFPFYEIVFDSNLLSNNSLSLQIAPTQEKSVFTRPVFENIPGISFFPETSTFLSGRPPKIYA